MVDYHVHPNFSHDARGSIEDYCQRAVEIGLKEICFTTHYEPDPVRGAIEFVMVNGKRLSPHSEWADAYFAAIEKARLRFPNLAVLAGVEIGYEMGTEGLVSDFLAKYRFDYVLGAVHCLDHVCLTSAGELEAFRAAFGKQSPSSIVEQYFKYIRAAAGAGLFDCLAHLDIYRKYIMSLYGPEFNECVRQGMRELLRDLVQTGIGLEVNTSAMRRADPEPYPAKEILRQAKDAGIKVFTIGSDAHKPEHLGSGLEPTTRLLSGLGITPARFRLRQTL